jgi:hypothetical protein
VLLQQALLLLPEPGVVLIVDQAILKHPRALVQPKGQHLQWARVSFTTLLTTCCWKHVNQI